jgi:hypothetical protein
VLDLAEPLPLFFFFFFLAKRFFIAGWERERAERAKREREGQGLKYPSVGLSMI